PYGSDYRSDHKISRSDLLRQASQIDLSRIDIYMRREEKQIHAIEPGSVHFRFRGEIQHFLEFDGRLRIRALADQARPHGVVDRRMFVVHDFFRNGSASGLPGPKCFRITNGSVSLVFSIRTPSLAAAAVTNNSSWVISPNRIIAGAATGCF